MVDHKLRRKNFSSFSKKEAFQALNLTDLEPWKLVPTSMPPSDFFHIRLQRLRRFDLESYEESKKLLIDAICEEALEGLDGLKIWKGATITSDRFTGNADYAITQNKRYFEAPILCIIEAKKDDFEQGLAQCLVEMKACQWCNEQLGRKIPVFGVVTNGTTWYFYQMLPTGVVAESLPFALGQIEDVLGFLREIFRQCQSLIVHAETENHRIIKN